MAVANLLVRPGGVRGGTLTVPGDKSVSHRALILSALADGETVIQGLLDSSDCQATAQALRQLGTRVHQAGREPDCLVEGPDRMRLHGTNEDIDCGNSGTAMRLLAGVLAGQPFESRLVGDASLTRRPMRRIAEPLQRMGAHIETTAAGTPPLRIHGRQPLRAIEYLMPVASAQVKSALLLAGLFANGETRVAEPGICRDHTERMLAAFGVRLQREANVVSLSPGRLRSPGVIDVPGDLSSAAFLLVLATIVPGCSIELRNAGINPTRTGILRLLERMGARIQIDRRRETRGGEPVADITAESSRLQAIDVNADDVALAIDEIPVLLIAAACAQGRTEVRGAGELRVKESDRLAAMAAGLQALGIEVETFNDGIAVTGGVLQGGVVDSAGDHRVAMAFAVAGAVAAGSVKISNTENIATSWPDFVADTRTLGLDIKMEQE